ncbi:hypothetical protein F4861DRAFT_130342 [Xylaria intraflava]|nr:hypothetical protein F4861DRAFT_130342 [Xylaria intraflava]
MAARLAACYAPSLASDITLVCEGEYFFVHKAILCDKSPIMALCIANVCVYEVTDFRPFILKCLLDYMYYGDYDQTPTPSPESIKYMQDNSDDGNLDEFEAMAFALADSWVYHGLVRCIGDRFGVTILADLAMIRLVGLVNDDWSAEAFRELLYETAHKSDNPEYQDYLVHKASEYICELRPIGFFSWKPCKDSVLGAMVLWIETEDPFPPRSSQALSDSVLRPASPRAP